MMRGSNPQLYHGKTPAEYDEFNTLALLKGSVQVNLIIGSKSGFHADTLLPSSRFAHCVL